MKLGKEFAGMICRMGIFLICAQSVVYFCPKASYEKYFKLLVSSMLLVQLFCSVNSLLGGEQGVKLENRIESYARELERELYSSQQEVSVTRDFGNSDVQPVEVEVDIQWEEIQGE